MPATSKIENDNLLISIIIPVYNVEQYLASCIDSVLNQTYQNIEIILIDDGSPDSCPSICDFYAAKDKRVRIIHQQNRGLSVARNVGIEAATGKYIVFLDSDDMLAQTDVIQNLADFFIKTKAEVTYCSNVIRFTENNDIIKPKELSDEFLLVDPVDWHSIVRKNCFCYSAWTFVVSRMFILEHSLFFKENLIYEDMEWIPRLLFAQKNLKFNIFTKPFYIYQRNSTSITSSFTQTHFQSLYFILLWSLEKIQENQNIQFMKMWFNINLYSMILYFEKTCLSNSDFYTSNIGVVKKLFKSHYKILTFRNRILYIFIKLTPKAFFNLRKLVNKMRGR